MREDEVCSGTSVVTCRSEVRPLCKRGKREEEEKERECKKRIEELLGGEQRVGGRGLAV